MNQRAKLIPFGSFLNRRFTNGVLSDLLVAKGYRKKMTWPSHRESEQTNHRFRVRFASFHSYEIPNQSGNISLRVGRL